MKDEIRNEWTYDQAPEQVWTYLTDSDLMALWLMPNNFKAQLGHEFQFRTAPMPDLGLDGIMHCRVTELDPCRKLSYSWKAGNGDGIFTLDTLVEWTLEPAGNGTKLSLKHSGFGANLEIMAKMTEGWAKKLQKIQSMLNEKSNANA